MNMFKSKHSSICIFCFPAVLRKRHRLLETREDGGRHRSH